MRYFPDLTAKPWVPGVSKWQRNFFTAAAMATGYANDKWHLLYALLELEQDRFGSVLEQMELEQAMREAEAGADELGLE